MSSDQGDVGELLEAAEIQALRLGHGHVGSEHILLALLQREGSVATDALWSLRVDLPAARAAVESAIPARSGRRVTKPRLTPRARSIIAATSKEAARRDATPTGEHVLLALLNEKNGVAERVLLNLGVPPSAVKARLLKLMDAG